MKNFMVVIIVAMSAATATLVAGESIGLIENLKGSIKVYSFKEEITAQDTASCERALNSAEAFIQAYEPKLKDKVAALKMASYVLLNTVNALYIDYIRPSEQRAQNNPFDTFIDKAEIARMEKAIQPLKDQLKKIKGSIFSNISLSKKSEAQKVYDAARDIFVDRIQRIIDEFAQFKKVSGKLSVNTSKSTVSEQSRDLMSAFENAGKKKTK